MQNINIPGTFPKASTLPKEMHLANWGQRWLESSPVQTCSHMTSWHRVSSKLQLWYFYILSSKALVSMEPTLECHRFETLATQVPESTANLCYTSWHNLSFYALAKKNLLAKGRTLQNAPHSTVLYHVAPNTSSFDDLSCSGCRALTQVPVQVAHLEALKEDSDTCELSTKLLQPRIIDCSKCYLHFFKTPTNLVSPNSHY